MAKKLSKQALRQRRKRQEYDRPFDLANIEYEKALRYFAACHLIITYAERSGDPELTKYYNKAKRDYSSALERLKDCEVMIYELRELDEGGAIKRISP